MQEEELELVQEPVQVLELDLDQVELEQDSALEELGLDFSQVEELDLEQEEVGACFLFNFINTVCDLSSCF